MKMATNTQNSLTNNHNNSNSNSNTSRECLLSVGSSASTHQKRSLFRRRRPGVLLVSAVALSIASTSAAFQYNSFVVSSTSCSSSSCPSSKNARQTTRDSLSSRTSIHVVTDPNQVVSMDLPEVDWPEREALEDIYLVRKDASDKPSSATNGKVKLKSKSKGDSGTTTTTKTTSRRKVQFKRLAPPSGTRSRRKNGDLTAEPMKRRLHAELTAENIRPKKASTMPGYGPRPRRQSTLLLNTQTTRATEGRPKKAEDRSAMEEKTLSKNSKAIYNASSSVPDSLIQFANELHEVDRISPKEEKILGAKTQEAIRMQNIHDGLVDKLNREPTDEEWCAAAGKINMEALSQTIEEGIEAKNQLVVANLRMVQGVVNVYIRNGLGSRYNAGDLMQEGVMALIRAAEKFDPARGFRFSTYAMYWIRAAIKRNQVFQSRVIPVPHRLYENHKRIGRVQKQLTDELQRPPTRQELSEAVGMSELQVDRCVAAMAQRCHSLDQALMNPLRPNNDNSRQDGLGELVASTSDDSGSKKLLQSFLREDLIKALRTNLNDEEVEVLLLRYGLGGDVAKKMPMPNNRLLTIAEVSRIAGLKPDKVRRIVTRSLKKLKAVIGEEWIEYERELQQ